MEKFIDKIVSGKIITKDLKKQVMGSLEKH